jgi:hypothetical protein
MAYFSNPYSTFLSLLIVFTSLVSFLHFPHFYASASGHSCIASNFLSVPYNLYTNLDLFDSGVNRKSAMQKISHENDSPWNTPLFILININWISALIAFTWSRLHRIRSIYFCDFAFNFCFSFSINFVVTLEFVTLYFLKYFFSI